MGTGGVCHWQFFLDTSHLLVIEKAKPIVLPAAIGAHKNIPVSGTGQYTWEGLRGNCQRMNCHFPDREGPQEGHSTPLTSQ